MGAVTSCEAPCGSSDDIIPDGSCGPRIMLQDDFKFDNIMDLTNFAIHGSDRQALHERQVLVLMPEDRRCSFMPLVGVVANIGSGRHNDFVVIDETVSNTHAILDDMCLTSLCGETRVLRKAEGLVEEIDLSNPQEDGASPSLYLQCGDVVYFGNTAFRVSWITSRLDVSRVRSPAPKHAGYYQGICPDSHYDNISSSQCVTAPTKNFTSSHHRSPRRLLPSAL